VKTVVFQSYRTHDVAPWVTTCLQSAETWASQRGFGYHFVDDRFFDYCPPWYRQKVAGDILLMSDLSRLMVARELLDAGHGRVIWIDADVLIFAPAAFSLDTPELFAFCDELWLYREGNQLLGVRRVNNAVCTFARGTSFLDFFIDAAQRMVRDAKTPVNPLTVGTNFLTNFTRLVPLQLIRGVGTFNPLLMEHLSRGDAEPLRLYRRSYAHPIAAANLCGSFAGKTSQNVTMSDEIYQRVIDALLGEAGRQISS
jgi:hypothetical protein